MPMSWEIPPSVYVYSLSVGTVASEWAKCIRRLIIPGPFQDIHFFEGMPYDMARNVATQQALDSGADWCLRGSSLVETANGPKRIKNIEVGDLVRTHKGRLREVTEVMKREYKQRLPLPWVHSPHGFIQCTPEHPFFISRDRGKGQFVRARDLLAGDDILYPAPWTDDHLSFDIICNKSNESGNGREGIVKDGMRIGTLPVTGDVARFLGLYLAEGCGARDGICFTFNNNEADYIAFVKKMSMLLFGRKASSTVRWATNVKINVRPLGELFRNWFGKKATEKRIPPFVFKWNLMNRLNFLLGYLQGDGHVSNTSPSPRGCLGIWNFATSSRKLGKDLVRLAASCGLRVTTSNQPAATTVMKTGHVIESGPYVKGRMTTKCTHKFWDLINAERDGDFLRIPIVHVGHEKRMAGALVDQFVYNLEVDEDHSYIADFATVHNCMSIDSDTIPPPDAILKLISCGRPVISGVYARRSPPVAVPVMIKNGQWITNYPPNAIIEVDVVGAGCFMIHRSILERVPPVDPQLGRHWFSWRVDRKQMLPEGEGMSEDFVLCRHITRSLGVPISVCTGVVCRHVGQSQALPGYFGPLEAA